MIAFDYIDMDAFSARYHTPNPTKSQIKAFKVDCEDLAKASNTDNEEYQKNAIKDLLQKTFGYICNVKDRIDLCIYEEGVAKVIIEVKALNNKTEFPKSPSNPLSKAFCQSVFYFLKEHIQNKNNEIKHIIICNPLSFFIFDASEFIKLSSDTTIKKIFSNTTDGTDKSTDRFYKDIQSHLKSDEFDKSIKYTYFALGRGGGIPK